MDNDFLDLELGPVQLPEEESASAYEDSSDHGNEDQDALQPVGKIEERGSHDGKSKKKSTRITADARERATIFTASEASDVRPLLHNSVGRSNRKRSHSRPDGPNERGKRLRSFYSHEYRELLNVDIADAALRSIQADALTCGSSQIGASIWTSSEKDMFFAALSRLGKDQVRAIAENVGSKSELQVYEYLRLLHEGFVERSQNDERHSLLDPTAIPAAVQISEECCEVIDRAADALANRQERYEEATEKQKWGDNWLLSADVCHKLEQQRNEVGEGISEGNEYQEILPAMDLLNLKNFLLLSETVFMNPASPREQENWREVGEPGETPAIRATAFDDFHALAVSITKRLVSTVLFVTMSRMRAQKSQKTKSADVSVDDVVAAAKILKLGVDNQKFWTDCPRRCHLRVLKSPTDEDALCYEDVEAVLQESCCQRSRSRSVSVPRSNHIQKVYESEEEDEQSSEDYVLTDSDLEAPGDPRYSRSPSPADRKAPTSDKQTAKRYDPLEIQRAVNEHVKAFDERSSLLEEKRLWDILQQEPPSEVRKKLADLPDEPPGKSTVNEVEMGWRAKTEGWADWELIGKIKEADFEANRGRYRLRRSLEHDNLDSDEVDGSDEQTEVYEVEDNEVDFEDHQGGGLTIDEDKSDTGEGQHDQDSDDVDKKELFPDASRASHELSHRNASDAELEEPHAREIEPISRRRRTKNQELASNEPSSSKTSTHPSAVQVQSRPLRTPMPLRSAVMPAADSRRPKTLSPAHSSTGHVPTSDKTYDKDDSSLFNMSESDHDSVGRDMETADVEMVNDHGKTRSSYNTPDQSPEAGQDADSDRGSHDLDENSSSLRATSVQNAADLESRQPMETHSGKDYEDDENQVFLERSRGSSEAINHNDDEGLHVSRSGSNRDAREAVSRYIAADESGQDYGEDGNSISAGVFKRDASQRTYLSGSDSDYGNQDKEHQAMTEVESGEAFGEDKGPTLPENIEHQGQEEEGEIEGEEGDDEIESDGEIENYRFYRFGPAESDDDAPEAGAGEDDIARHGEQEENSQGEDEEESEEAIETYRFGTQGIIDEATELGIGEDGLGDLLIPDVDSPYGLE